MDVHGALSGGSETDVVLVPTVHRARRCVAGLGEDCAFVCGGGL